MLAWSATICIGPCSCRTFRCCSSHCCSRFRFLTMNICLLAECRAIFAIAAPVAYFSSKNEVRPHIALTSVILCAFTQAQKGRHYYPPANSHRPPRLNLLNIWQQIFCVVSEIWLLAVSASSSPPLDPFADVEQHCSKASVGITQLSDATNHGHKYVIIAHTRENDALCLLASMFAYASSTDLGI